MMRRRRPVNVIGKQLGGDEPLANSPGHTGKGVTWDSSTACPSSPLSEERVF